jgi:2-polyprenyl-3-methyl-5-hydroxy-6-metoxy-1,4-benzoquinol methylase
MGSTKAYKGDLVNELVFKDGLCPVCGSMDLSAFFELKQVPVLGGVLTQTKEAAVQADKGDILLSFCHSCGYVGNRSLDPEKIHYLPGYNLSLSHSQVYRDFLTNLGTRLMDTYELQNKEIVEIGCGDGKFLKMLCRAGKNHGTGFDPTNRRNDTTEDSVTIVPSFFPENYSGPKFDFLCCRQVLQQVSHPVSPRSFLERIHQALTENGTVYFEVPNAEYVFGKNGLWTVIYEYSSYFNAESLSNLFAACGFKPIRVEPCFDEGQYLGIEAVQDSKSQFRPTDSNALNSYFA